MREASVIEGQSTNPQIEVGGVCFDPEEISLVGFYGDEVTAHRAKRNWKRTLETYFLLEIEDDFELEVSARTCEDFTLRCQFNSACARYAFWRLTNQQAPEAQYAIETGHLARTEGNNEYFLQAPDLRLSSEHDDPLILRPQSSELELNEGWFDKVRDLIEKMSKK